MEQEDSLRLRRANRIKTIHSSLAIEGNTLSESEVQAVLEGKKVVAPLKEIQEVRNAIKTYELYPKLNPFSIQDCRRPWNECPTDRKNTCRYESKRNYPPGGRQQERPLGNRG